ncbi:unnamed protein product [Somion occarium]|uniref:Gamma-glutamylcyclotransferase AIG2-like domain-containing protein n=1 Tax=Somion occarium TaxID=3059160 RepID=A0ABP1DVW6_9APHY
MDDDIYETLVEDPTFSPDWSTLSRRHELHSATYEISADFASSESPLRLLFFYGTLSLPHVLKRVLSLTNTPPLQSAFVFGYSVKMWGPYPALVQLKESDDEATDKEPVEGKAFWASEEQIRLLTQHEGENYALAPIAVHIGQTVTSGYTFVWCGYPEEVDEGAFDPSLFPET